MSRTDPLRQLNDAALGLSAASRRLAGRRILVVGAGQRVCDDPDAIGNGRAISLLLARQAAMLVCADRDAASAAATVARIQAQGNSASALVCDIAAADAVPTMLDRAAAAFGGLDGIVVNAGISLGHSLADETAEGWDAVMAVNLRAAMLIARGGLPLLEPGGSMVFVSSLASIHPGGRNPAYEASKAGLTALVRAAALEGQARGIRVNGVAPGLIDTPMGRAATMRNNARTARLLPFGRQGTAWELAHAVMFLIGDEASYVNAQTLFVDGGLSQQVVLAEPTGSTAR